MTKKQKDSNSKDREKMSTVSLGREEYEFSEALSTDLRKLNKNKFFFNMEGKKEGGSQD